MTSIRMAVDAATFGKVSEAVPEAELWMRGIPLTSGRTGEIVALAGPEALRRHLKKAGLTEEQIEKAGTTVGDALRQLLSKDAAEKITNRITLLK